MIPGAQRQARQPSKRSSYRIKAQACTCTKTRHSATCGQRSQPAALMESMPSARREVQTTRCEPPQPRTCYQRGLRQARDYAHGSAIANQTCPIRLFSAGNGKSAMSMLACFPVRYQRIASDTLATPRSPAHEHRRALREQSSCDVQR